MRTFPRLLIVIVLLAAFAIGGWYVDAQRAKQRSLLSGFFESQPAQVSSRIGGRVARIFVREGDAVHAGQPLLELEVAPARADTRAKEETAEQAFQQYREALAGPRPEDLRKQEAVVAEMQADLSRLRNGPLPEEIGQARAKWREADAQYRKTLAGARPQEIAQAQAAERNAWARLAQAKRGQTPEEKAQAKARLDAAAAQERLARSDTQRYETLYAEDAVSRQQRDQAEAALREATANRQDMEAAWRRAQEGTPPEEMAQAQSAWLQSKAALDLVRAGSRKEDIQAAAAQRQQAQQALAALLRGSRREDIRAAAARLKQAQDALAELRAGNRKEQIAQAKAAAKAAQAQAQSSEMSLDEWTVRAPQDGVVESIPISIGDLVPANNTLLRLNDPNDIWIHVYVPESRLAQVMAGSDASLRVDGLSEPVPAVVESIATRGEFTPANLQTPDERGKQVFAMRLRLQHPDPRVKAGMVATVLRIGDWTP
ncbi:MAG TPA: HlyD family efflux transporter periplasmic adaptor subunit [Chthonomonadaceae bacterium]|nr:HlyD family efflux transporter periplasmic adaptor subunit [Chthonomonadaceae bacterium]